jgi:ABC-type glycerol-3-phosphate transport system permease component
MSVTSHSRRRARSVVLHTLAIVTSIVVAFPVVWLLLETLKSSDQLALPRQWLPLHPTLQNYANIWSIAHFDQYFATSAIVALSTTALGLALAAPAAYGFTRLRLRFAKVMQGSFLFAQMLPGVLIVIPYFVTMRTLGLLNTHASLILIYTALVLPICTWLLIGVFAAIPAEIDEAALVDGCGRFRAFAQIVLPLAAPGVVAVGLFAFLAAWKEYLFALAVVTKPSLFTVTIGVASLYGEAGVRWGEATSAAVIATLPVLVAFLYLQRFLVSGLAAGALKG